MTDADTYTNPERATEISRARRMKKRIDADRRKFGNCCICIHREVTFDRPHCRNKPDRQRSQCQLDALEPKFRLDDTSLEKYRDAA